MKTIFLLSVCGAMAWSQAAKRVAPPPSAQYLKARVYTAEEDTQVLKLYEGLRTCDVIDALDLGRTEPNAAGRSYPHGTLTGYNLGACRCPHCRTAAGHYHQL